VTKSGVESSHWCRASSVESGDGELNYVGRWISQVIITTEDSWRRRDVAVFGFAGEEWEMSRCRDAFCWWMGGWNERKEFRSLEGKGIAA
jgi:hypothetical protein